jgi:hypothetical protein
VKHARPFTSASSRRKLPILALAFLALAYCLVAIVTSALTTPSSHSAGASSSSAAWLVDRDGAIYSIDGAPDYGSASNQWVSPIVGMAATPNDGGYWEVARDGRIYPFGNAGYFGSASNEWFSPIVGMAATPDGKGYWEVASDGRIYPFGDADSYGSAASQDLNAPIVGMAATPDGKGYWEVASDGGIFNFGDARYYGSTGSIHLNQPVVGMATTPDGKGYWMAARNGGVFSFGDAVFQGSTPAQGLAPISAITASPDGQGYLEAATNGALFPHGDAVAPLGSTKGMSLSQPVVGVVTVSVTVSSGGSTTTTTQPAPKTTPTTQPTATTPTTQPATTTTSTQPAPKTTPTTQPPATTTTQPPTTSASSSGEMAAPAGYTSSQMTFDDSFSGSSLNSSNWTSELAPGSNWNDEDMPSGDSSAGSNQAAYWAPSQVTVDNGLTLSARQTTSSDAGYSKFKWVSGVITSKFTLPTTGWYVQIRAQMPDTSDGMWPALWFLPSNSAQEFDGFEGGWTGNANQQGHSDLFLGSGQQQEVWSTSGTDITAGYNTYGFQYTPGKSVTVYFNGKQVDQVSSSDVSSEAYYMLIELQVASSATSGWHTALSSSTPSPSNMNISEVQVYS